MLYFFYGSRVVFICLIPLNYFFFLIIYDKKNVNIFFFFQLLISLMTFLIPFVLNPSGYHPAHIIKKGFLILGPSTTLFLILISLLIICLFIYFKDHRYKLLICNFVKNKIIIMQLGLFSFPLLIIIITTLIRRLSTNTLYSWKDLAI